MSLELLLGPEFKAGVAFGLATAAVASAAGLVWRSRHGRPIPLAGVALVVAVLAGLAYTETIPRSLIWAMVALAFGGLFAGRVRGVWPVPLLLAVPGAWLVAFRSEVVLPTWATWFVFAAVVVASPLAVDFEQRRTTWTPALYALFVAGIFAAVPDTEQALVLLGAAAVAALLPLAGATFGSVGMYPAVGIALWVIAQGATGRPAAVLGAAACLGVLVMEPIARRLSPRRITLLDRVQGPYWEGLVVMVIQLVAVLAASRIAGLEPDPVIAAAEASLVLAALAGLLVVGGYLPWPRSPE